MSGTRPVKDWTGAVIASETDEENMINTMNKFYKFDSKARFNSDNMWAALKNKNVAICTIGDDHVFIIDGLLVTSIYTGTRQLVAMYDVYWHANLGWNDNCTGYYLADRPSANTLFEAGQYQQWDYQMNYWNNIRAKSQIITQV